MNLRILAVGQDDYWLNAVHQATSDWTAHPATLKCSGALLKCISNLPRPKANIILLIDASGQEDLPRIVKELRRVGWKYVIIVAADPSAKEATSVLRRSLGYDYWPKTYDDHKIRNQIKNCFDEIIAEKQPGKSKRDVAEN